MGRRRVDKLTSLAAYAKHRGVSRQAVTKAVQEGRLRKSVIVHRGKTAIEDVELADREWDQNTRSITPSSALREAIDAKLQSVGIPPLIESQARLEAARAGLAELDLAERQGKLVDADVIGEKFVDVVTAAKTKLLGLPTRVKQRAPHIGAADIALIDELVREALEGLADGS